MTATAKLGRPAGAVYPPSFCDWRLLLVVAAITELSVLLVGLGKEGLLSWRWLAPASLYAQWMALFCAAGLCITSAWISRWSPRGAWLGSWLIALLLAAAFSLGTWLAVGQLNLWVEPPSARSFIFESVFAVGIVALALFRYLLIRARWRAELMAQAEARVQALQARIRPHFLFNSLNTIANLVATDPAGAEAAIEDLADIFRGSMRQADQPISLAEELNMARQYLDMEQRRLGERLRVDWRVNELPGDAAILPLMLQPLLENAVGHGISPRTEGGTISVYGRIEGELVVVTIANPAAPAGGATAGHGMALQNIRERLQLAYGARGSLVTYDNEQLYYVVLSLPYAKHSDR